MRCFRHTLSAFYLEFLLAPVSLFSLCICKYKGHAEVISCVVLQWPGNCKPAPPSSQVAYCLKICLKTYHALSAVSAGELVALVHHLDLAVPAREADGAGARVVLAGVEARGSVVTRSVIGAEVEVLVAHLTTPTLFTLAGPGTGAGAVNTPGVDLALGALRPLPALVTSEIRKQK